MPKPDASGVAGSSAVSTSPKRISGSSNVFGALGCRPVTGAIIAGIGQTEFSKASGRSELQLAAEASQRRDRRRRA